MKSIQQTITAADNFLDRYKNYRRVQKIYFMDQTIQNLDALRFEGKITDQAAEAYENERNGKSKT